MNRVSVSVGAVAAVVLATSLVRGNEAGPAEAARRFRESAFGLPLAAKSAEPEAVAMYREDEEGGTTTTTVTESGTRGGMTYRRSTTITRSRSIESKWGVNFRQKVVARYEKE